MAWKEKRKKKGYNLQVPNTKKIKKRCLVMDVLSATNKDQI